MSNHNSQPPNRAHIATEKRNPRTMNLHTLSITETVDLIHQEDREVLHALKRAGKTISRFIEGAEPGFLAGGRLVYVGAGTSGRLGVLDASEAPPTFQVDPGKVVGVIAGGDASLRRSSEGKEDEARGAWPELEALALTSQDTVLGIAAGGTTPYVHGALEFCKDGARGTARPLTGLLVCTQMDKPEAADHLIILKTGPEVLTGSTRMKAGTATKLALNTISTTLMVRSGRVYENLMVDLRATNDKLRDRAARIVGMLTGLSRDECFQLLEAAGGAVKTAVVMHRHGVDREEAERTLQRVNGRLDGAIED